MHPERQNAKSRVIALCEMLARIYPKLSDRNIQSAAIDLHDLERACRKVSVLIGELRRLDPSSSPDEARRKLIAINNWLVDEVVEDHASSLKTFLKRIGIRPKETRPAPSLR